MDFLNQPTRNLFFTGKGGVGKTSLACAGAVALADRGLRVLVVSTDPASNLDEVLGVRLGNQPRSIPGVHNLFALNIDPAQAAHEYRERVVGPYRNLLPAAVISGMEEQLSGACTVEIAAFDEFARLLGDPETTAEFDHILFDTAPTGHTLRLLSLPSAWTGFMDANTTGGSCLGPLAGLQAQQRLYRDTVAALARADLTTVVLVTRPETAALREAERCRRELAGLGVGNQQLVVNGVFIATLTDDPIAVAVERRGRDALHDIPSGLANLPRTVIRLAPGSVVGIAGLRQLGQAGVAPQVHDRRASPKLLPLGQLLDELARPERGVILTMGKGGVGKTTIAAAVAVELARRGYQVHLTTTDPAAHVRSAVDDSVANLTVSRIDPQEETRKYTAEVLATAGASLDAPARALLEEDLRSPCTEEVAVFRAFAQAVEKGQDGFVVLDTAPTGHTLLLLDAALAYHREVARQASETPDAVQQLLPRLRDPAHTRVLIVTLPEATPVHEAAGLQQDLVRAGIQPFAWVINQCLTPLTVRDPVLCARRHQESAYLREVAEGLTERAVLVPWQTTAPVGAERLRGLVTAS